MSPLRTAVDTTFATTWSRQVGAAHLVLAGLANVVLALAFLRWLGSAAAVETFLGLAASVWSETTMLERGDSIRTFVGTVAPAVGVLVFVLGVAGTAVGAGAFRGRFYRASLVASVTSTVTIVTIPLCVVSGLLLWLSRDHFDSPAKGAAADFDARGAASMADPVDTGTDESARDS